MQGPNPEVHAGWQLWVFFFYRQGAPYLCYIRLCMPREGIAVAVCRYNTGWESVRVWTWWYCTRQTTDTIIKHQIQIQPRIEQGRRQDDLVIAQHDAEALTFNTTISVVAREEQHHPTNINISTVLNEVLFLRASKKEQTAASERFERAETETQQHSRLRSDNRYAEWRRICAVYCLM